MSRYSQPKTGLRAWTARVLLGLLTPLAAFVAFTPGLNLAHYTPNKTMRGFGISYEYILAYEQHFHIGVHILVAFVLTILISGSRLFCSRYPTARILCSAGAVLVMAVAAEFVQAKIGRNVEYQDLLFGTSGIAVAVAILLVLRRHSEPG
jgi:VanZ family protein